MKLTYIILSIIIVGCFASNSYYDKIKMDDILQFELNRLTTGRRFEPCPQLMCVDNTHELLCQKYKIHFLTCYNLGSEDDWECETYPTIDDVELINVKNNM